MFYGKGYMGGMHAGWWQCARGHATGDSTRGVRRRLASGALTPQQYEEHKALLDRDN